MSDPTLPHHTVPPDDAASTELRSVVGQLDDRIAGGALVADGYRIIRKLGEGAFGTVWLAEDRAGGRAAIKFFARGTGRQWKSLQDEVQTLARLDATAGVIPIKEVRPDADPPYFVMAYAA